MTSNSRQPSFIRLLDEGEPFRLLFPVGIALGLVGALLWPLWVAGITETYPGLSHSRIMIQGYMTAFVLGFLGTALPRMLEVRRIGASTTATLATCMVGIGLLHLLRLHLYADILYLFSITAFVGLLLARARHRRDLPPPAFVLVAGGLACAGIGTLLQIALQTVPGHLPAIAFPLARLLANEAFLLLPVMGVGAFFLPRVLGCPTRQVFPDAPHPTPAWSRQARFAGICGGLIVLTFIFEGAGWFRSAFLVRALVLVGFFVREIPLFSTGNKTGSLATPVRIALLSLPAGYGLMAAWPLYRMSIAHVIFITGFSLVTFAVASWVMLGHSGQSALFRARLPSIRILTGLIVLAMVTRVTADWMPDIRLTHYAYAALAWSLAAVIWTWRILPAVLRPDDDP
jgi:uncharacterized protein involved in response to NO